MGKKIDPTGVLSYDAHTGELRWASPGKKRVVGALAGTKDTTGYLRVRYDGKRVLVHRLCWFIHTGRWPESQIDHRNGNKSDNRASNLREASAQQNQHNVGLRRDNESGFKGVCFCRRTGKWSANIRTDGKNKHLGRFNTKEEAARAYQEKSMVLHKDFLRSA